MKGLGMPSESKSGSNICLEKDNNLSFDPDENSEIFKTLWEFSSKSTKQASSYNKCIWY